MAGSAGAGAVDRGAAPAVPGGNLADLVVGASETAPARPGLVDAAGSGSLTWRRVAAAVDRYAGVLTGLGVARGDRVAVVLSNSLQSCVALFAVLRAGAITVPVGTDAAPQEVERVLDHSGVCFALGLSRVTANPPKKIISLPDPDLGVDSDDDGVPRVPAVGGGEDTALICYTSGTSGSPRGVLLSHRALLANAAQCAALRPAPVTATDRVLLAVPLSHAYGLSALWQVAAAGATGVLLPRFGVDRALDACRDHRLTTVIGVPAMYQALVTAGRDRLGAALATARLLTSGAAPLDPRTLAAVRAATGLAIHEGYGLTETGPVLTSTLVGGVAKPGAVGRAIPGVELRLVDADGRPVATADDPDDPDGSDESVVGEFTDDSETGLVAARGANLFSGYWPDGRGGPDADGWFRTGDVGYFDADGDLRLVDRAHDLIIVNGFNVYPREVEQVVAELPGVAEVAAVGVPDERTGERVKVVVVAREGAELTEQALLAHCAAHLARFKVPGVVEFAAALPHTVTGKLRRAGLRGSVTT
ncbi:AMP-binding protein [Actinokineospora auranticolor]|uniref:Long-chain acyl-CoA synthetase n=2 Tax=Actinokineospora auranticolor TaxID=155976 RepID=A0A2S6GW21_9PSEU|nr:AMP-binding protein [Actinokineospora auranticolor]PPK69409.1 long-chain acyl-CoA synthetase [Actinokineospora auranticolor]